jgi:AraC family ethanolamine operon transcriptional activator
MVHQALKQTNGKYPVVDIAAQYGFWHMGQFSKDYKNLFGELPSSTLNGV